MRYPRSAVAYALAGMVRSKRCLASNPFTDIGKHFLGIYKSVIPSTEDLSGVLTPNHPL